MNYRQPKILVIAGSVRAGSYNRKLAQAAAGALRDAGAEVTLADLKDYPMPLYDGDTEAAQGLPEPARPSRTSFWLTTVWRSLRPNTTGRSPRC